MNIWKVTHPLFDQAYRGRVGRSPGLALALLAALALVGCSPEVPALELYVPPSRMYALHKPAGWRVAEDARNDAFSIAITSPDASSKAVILWTRIVPIKGQKPVTALEVLRTVCAGLKGAPKKATQGVIDAIAGKDEARPKPTSKDPFEARMLEAGLSPERARDIRKHVRCRIDAPTKKSKGSAVGTSRFGGVPDMPEGSTWPTAQISESVFEPGDDEDLPLVKGKYAVPLSFIAQLAMADLKAHDLDGLLQF